jgi:hypothetical protein
LLNLSSNQTRSRRTSRNKDPETASGQDICLIAHSFPLNQKANPQIMAKTPD